MGKKKDKLRKEQSRASLPSSTPGSSLPVVSKRGWKIIGGGISLLFIGFILLSFTDSQGQNIPSFLSPFVLILGYALIGFGIVAKDSNPPPLV